MSEERTDGGTAEDTRNTGAHEGWLSRLWLTVSNRYERYRYLEKEDRVTQKWHSWGTIISHWSMAVLMLLAIQTGLSKFLGVYGHLDIGIWGGYNPAFRIHVWSGIVLAIVAFVLYPYYSFVVDGKSPIISRDQVQEQIVIIFAFLGLASYIPGYKKARRSFDPDTGKWIAHHPTQTAFWYATWLLVAILTLTGFALWASLLSDPAWWIAGLGFMESWFTFETILRVHLISTGVTIGAVLLHAYFPLLPSNHDLLNLMIDGRLKGWRISDEDRPEPRGTSRSKDTLHRPLAGLSKLLGLGTEVQERLTGTHGESDTDDGTDSEEQSESPNEGS